VNYLGRFGGPMPVFGAGPGFVPEGAAPTPYHPFSTTHKRPMTANKTPWPVPTSTWFMMPTTP